MTGQDWRDLWHRAQDGEALTELEQAELGRALSDAQHQRQVVSWSGVPRLLRSAPVPAPPFSVTSAARQERQISQALSERPPQLPSSLAAELAQDIALSRRLGAPRSLPHSLAAEVAARIAEDADPVAAALRRWPRPQLPCLAGRVSGGAGGR